LILLLGDNVTRSLESLFLRFIVFHCYNPPITKPVHVGWWRSSDCASCSRFHNYYRQTTGPQIITVLPPTWKVTRFPYHLVWLIEIIKEYRAGIAGKVQANERDNLKLANGGQIFDWVILGCKTKKIYCFTFWLQFKYSILVLSTVLTVLHLFVAKNWGISVLYCGKW
jgi:hypothetical protein